MRPRTAVDPVGVESALHRLAPVLAQQGIRLAVARDGEPDALVPGADVPLPGADALVPGPEERRLAAGMHPLRRATFLAGRCAARRALRAAGLPAGEVGHRVGGRVPAFPEGAVGSLTHSGGVAVAVVAAAARHRALGCDLELRPLPLAAAHLVLGPAELAWLDRAPDPGAAERRLHALFSAKEAAFKAYHGLLPAGAPGLLREIAAEPARCGFRARLAERPEGPALSVRLRWVPAGGVFSWATVERTP